MIPQEKATELYNKYFLLHESLTDENGVWIVSALNKGLAKKCALIAIDEIIHYSKAHGFIELTKFHEEVKQEIENL
jgi:hypothetical protein